MEQLTCKAGLYSFVVPEGDGCKSLPAGALLTVDPFCDLQEGIHILKNARTGVLIARWIYYVQLNGRAAIMACKYDGGERIDVMEIDIAKQDCEWQSVGRVTGVMAEFRKKEFQYSADLQIQCRAKAVANL